MADATKNTVRHRSLRGITPFLAAGHAVVDAGALATATSYVLDITDSEITPDMVGFAQIQVSADDDMYISSVLCGVKKITVTLRNRSGGNLTAGNTTIAYFAVPSEKD